MISECGHMLCQVCEDVLFVRHSASCPECGCSSSFWEMLYDDPLVEKEIFHRKKLEQFEESVFNMVYDRDLEQTKQMVADFARANEDLFDCQKSQSAEQRSVMDRVDHR
ncbi:CDK-activating kinase assembly factor MAT1 [Trichinella nativa]|uniref:CDK-activating kinase assembly factor MAT1 n=1 Tax=Trichinella nativa TaxID=6335 RepID=A0A0V1LKG3_9BILA|nr:CDK-activating kinase assembly factor MAT1 [Trichinella nativa]